MNKYYKEHNSFNNRWMICYDDPDGDSVWMGETITEHDANQIVSALNQAEITDRVNAEHSSAMTRLTQGDKTV